MVKSDHITMIGMQEKGWQKLFFSQSGCNSCNVSVPMMYRVTPNTKQWLDILLAAPRAVSGLTYRIFIITHNICTGHQMATGLQEPVVS